MAVYATRADLLSALSYDSQAKLTTDITRKWTVGTGDGVETTFDTPFIEVTSIKGYLDGTQVTSPAPTLSRGTGTGGRDQIVFGSAPALGKVVSVTVDASAINADVLDAVLASVSADFDGYLISALPISDATLLASLEAKAILFARVRLRGRRNLDVVDPIEMEYRAAVRWLEAVAEGKIPLPSPSTSGSSEEGAYVYGSHASVFSDPDEEISL
jgi:phage gp36-like protein